MVGQCPSRAPGGGEESMGCIAVWARSSGWSDAPLRSRRFAAYGAEMSGPIHTLSVPAELKIFEGPSCLLPGESRKEFEIIRRMIIEDIGPKTNLEWLWILDLTELSWEILRYRRLKEKILQAYRASAIASLLQRLDGLGMPEQSRVMVQTRSRRSALEWHEDSNAASEIEARLQRNGFDLEAI